MTHKSASGEHKVGTCGVKVFIYKKILLFPTEIREHLFNLGVKHLADRHCSVVNRFESLFEGSFIVESLTSVGNKHSGDTESVVLNKHGRSWVPSRVAASLKSGTNTAAWKRRSVRLLLSKRFAVESFNHTALVVVIHKGVVLFGSSFGKGLKPVSNVGYTVSQSPSFHTGSHVIGGFAVEGFSVVDAVDKRIVSLDIEILMHFFAVEHQLAEIFRRTCVGSVYCNGFLFESVLYYVKSKFAHNVIILCVVLFSFNFNNAKVL